MANVKPIPEGFHTVTPSFIFRDARKAIDYYKRAFGAQEIMVMPGPDGKVMHAEMKIGDSILMLGEEMMGNRSAESIGESPSGFYLYVENVDAVFKKAIAAGGQEVMPVADMFWGDRMGSLKDPFGYRWSLATHVKDMTPEEMKKGQDEWMKQMAGA